LETAEKLIKQNDNIKLYCKVPQELNSCNETTFTFPVTETEIEEMANNFKGKYSAGIDEISDYVVNKCTEAIKNCWLILGMPP
jgi:hypothetical protein